MTPLDRLLRNTDRSGTCWLWTRRRNRDGYGLASYEGREMGAHRFAYLVLVGPISAGHELDHLCKNRACIRPDHLEPVTHRENVRRSDAVQPTCPRGHAFTPENTTVRPNGTRNCKRCHADRERTYRATRRAALTAAGEQ